MTPSPYMLSKKEKKEENRPTSLKKPHISLLGAGHLFISIRILHSSCEFYIWNNVFPLKCLHCVLKCREDTKIESVCLPVCVCSYL